MIVSDCIPAFKSHADGRLYDSKSGYYKTLKDKGFRIVEDSEIGKPVPEPWSPPVIDDIKEAYCKVRDGYRPEPLPLSEEAI